MKPDWTEWLRATYSKCRNDPYWEALRALHDPEDQAYFDMLDEVRRKNESFLQEVKT